MTDATPSEPSPLVDDRHIQPGHNILVRLPTREIRAIKLDLNPGEKTINFGKFGSFRQKALIGQPYGLTYEVQSSKTLSVVPVRRLEELEDTGATNELIVDGGSVVQPLSFTEIETLKNSGSHVTEIIQKQIENHINYDLKTEYSKEKYKKRKHAKFAKEITVVDPTLFNVAQYFYEKDPNRILNMRVDTLGQIANLANLRPGGKFIIVDSTGGILVAAALERLGGSGRALFISDLDCPPVFPILNIMNMTEEVKSTLRCIDWAAADEDHNPVRAPVEPDGGEYRSEGQKERYLKRKRAIEAFEQVREELFAGEWDGILVAAPYEPFSVVKRLSQYLAGSASITIYSQHLQVLTEAQAKMRPIPSYLSPSITEAWTRQYQVLPGRTHPMMNMTGGGGYILHSIYVYDDPKASSALAGFRQRLKKRKLDTSERQNEANGTSSQDVLAVDDDGDNAMETE